jgi:hypothetical protein
VPPPLDFNPMPLVHPLVAALRVVCSVTKRRSADGQSLDERDEGSFASLSPVVPKQRWI